MKKPERCDLCQGNGITDIFGEIKCEKCKGSGLLIAVYNQMTKIPYDKTNINIPYNKEVA
jgi:DnaJ-class molecular chaperone